MRLRLTSCQSETTLFRRIVPWMVGCLLGLTVVGCRSVHSNPAPINVQYNKCFISVTIGEKELTAILDTGATHSVIDLKLAEDLELTLMSDNPDMEVAGIGEYNGRLARALVPEFRIGSLTFQDWIMVGVDFKEAPVWNQHQASLIIGMDVLQSAQAQIHLNSGSLIFKTPYRALRLE